MVLEIRYQGEKIAPGMVLPKTSKIDLVLEMENDNLLEDDFREESLLLSIFFYCR